MFTYFLWLSIVYLLPIEMPRSLLHFCRLTIRAALGPQRLKFISRLQISKFLIRFLNFEWMLAYRNMILNLFEDFEEKREKKCACARFHVVIQVEFGQLHKETKFIWNEKNLDNENQQPVVFSDTLMKRQVYD